MNRFDRLAEAVLYEHCRSEALSYKLSLWIAGAVALLRVQTRISKRSHLPRGGLEIVTTQLIIDLGFYVMYLLYIYQGLSAYSFRKIQSSQSDTQS
jgi:hypothetical protein